MKIDLVVVRLSSIVEIDSAQLYSKFTKIGDTCYFESPDIEALNHDLEVIQNAEISEFALCPNQS